MTDCRNLYALLRFAGPACQRRVQHFVFAEICLRAPAQRRAGMQDGTWGQMLQHGKQ